MHYAAQCPSLGSVACFAYAYLSSPCCVTLPSNGSNIPASLLAPCCFLFSLHRSRCPRRASPVLTHPARCRRPSCCRCHCPSLMQFREQSTRRRAAWAAWTAWTAWPMGSVTERSASHSQCEAPHCGVSPPAPVVVCCRPPPQVLTSCRNLYLVSDAGMEGHDIQRHGADGGHGPLPAARCTLHASRCTQMEGRAHSLSLSQAVQHATKTAQPPPLHVRLGGISAWAT